MPRILVGLRQPSSAQPLFYVAAVVIVTATAFVALAATTGAAQLQQRAARTP